MKRNAGFYLSLIVLAAIAVAFFVYPKGWGQKFLPWKLGLDLVGGSHLVYEADLEKVVDADQDSVLNGLRDVIEKRVNLFGVAEPQVYIARGADTTKAQLIVELAGVTNLSDAIQQIGETPFLDFREVQKNGTTSDPIFIPTALNGRFVKGATVAFNDNTRSPEVSITFTDEGAKLFEQITEKNVGKPLAIFLDDQLIEMPTVNEKIVGGKAVITGRFTIAQVKQLVERFNAGALPVPIKLINQQTVSSTLGADSLRKVLVAGAIGTLLVILFMILYYGTFGVYSSLALIIYVIINAGIFKLFGVTMTLAGIAGFIITIGMAVDANILIFERVREEAKRGLSKAASVSEGFARAWPSIRDSNTSTMITAVILYFFTSSFVRGFALTLGIGVIVSLFSAITTTRLFLQVFRAHESK